MATPKTVLTYPLNGSQKDFPIPFEYLARKFVQVTLIGVDRKLLVLNTDYRFSTRTTITTTIAWGAAQGYNLIEIRRYTSASERLVDFSDGSILRAYDLNTAQVQSLHIAEEGRDIATDTIGVDNNGQLDARGRRIVNLADAVNPGDAVSLNQLQQWNESALNSSIAAGQSATASQNSRLASEAGRDSSVDAKTSAETARDVTLEARDVTTTARDVTTTARDVTTTARDVVVAQVPLATAQAVIATNKATESAASAQTAATYATQVQYGTVPLFSVQWWGGKRSAIPAGHIPADGQTISRALYTDVTANVVAMMGTITDASWVATPTLRGNWATGDGSSTWRVPDLNGKSSGSLGATFLRGDGVLSAAIAGTIQLDELKQHGHTYNSSVNGGVYNGDAGNIGFYYTTSVSNSGQTGGAETRPLNTTGCFIIKVFGAVNNSGSVDANQIVTTLGLHNARLNDLEVINEKAYSSRQLGTEIINPVGPQTLHWAVGIANKGVTYTGSSGGRQFVVPSSGVYRIVMSLLAGSNDSRVYLRNTRGGVIQPAALVNGFTALNGTPITVTWLGRLVGGDAISVVLSNGSIISNADQYNGFVIERIDN